MYDGLMRNAEKQSGNDEVKFEFKHLLSKVRVSYTNVVDPYVRVKISDLKITVPAAGQINLASSPVSWNIIGSGTTLIETMTNTSDEDETNDPVVISPTSPNNKEYSEDLFFIPSAAREYNLSFKVTLVMDDLNGKDLVVYEAVKNAKVETALLMGKAYEFATTISSNILVNNPTFEVIHVQGWNDFTTGSQLAVASKLGGEVILYNNELVVSNTIKVVDDLTIKSNDPKTNPDGYKITYNGSGYLFNVVNETYDEENPTTTTLTIGGPVLVDSNGDGKTDSNDSEVSSVVSITSNGSIATVGQNSEIIINGGMYQSDAATLYNSNGGDIYITDGTFISNSESPELFTITGGASGLISLTGGKYYKWNPENYVASGYISVKDNTDRNYYLVGIPEIVTFPETTTNPLDDLRDVLVDPFVTEVNINTNINNKQDNYYGIDVDHDVNINGNDINIVTTGGHGYKEYGFYISNNANVRIKDVNMYGGGLYVSGGANVLFESSKVQHYLAGLSGRNMIYIAGGSTLTLKDSEFINDKESHRYIYTNNSTVIIEGGSFRCVVSGVDKSSMVNPPFIIANNGKVIIKYGTFNFNLSYLNSDNIYTGGQLIIEGGTFTNSSVIKATAEQVVIKGGTFKYDPTTWVPQTGEYTITPNNPDNPTEWTVTGSPSNNG